LSLILTRCARTLDQDSGRSTIFPMRKQIGVFSLGWSGRACIAISLSLLLSFASRAQQKHGVAQRPAPAAHQSVTQDLAYGGSLVVSVAPNLPKFTFRIIPDVQGNDQF